MTRGGDAALGDREQVAHVLFDAEDDGSAERGVVLRALVERRPRGGALERRPRVEYTLAQFNDSCIEFDTAFFGEEAKRVGISMQVIDECFWRMVEDASSADDVCEVKCGTEIDTTKHGSGFPRRGETLRVKIEGVSADDIKELAESKWNLNNVARASGEHPSVLASLREDLPGVTTPVLEVGSTFSSTTWRREHHDLYRITYNHWGAPKTWYCVPASAADKFEECFKNVMPDVYEARQRFGTSLHDAIAELLDERWRAREQIGTISGRVRDHLSGRVLRHVQLRFELHRECQLRSD